MINLASKIARLQTARAETEVAKSVDNNIDWTQILPLLEALGARQSPTQRPLIQALLVHRDPLAKRRGLIACTLGDDPGAKELHAELLGHTAALLSLRDAAGSSCSPTTARDIAEICSGHLIGVPV